MLIFESTKQFAEYYKPFISEVVREAIQQTSQQPATNTLLPRYVSTRVLCGILSGDPEKPASRSLVNSLATKGLLTKYNSSNGRVVYDIEEVYEGIRTGKFKSHKCIDCQETA